MKSIQNQRILITGSTDGIGYITARRLAEMGANVILHGRNEEKIRRTQEAVKRAAERGGHVESFVADFSSLDEVRGLAESLKNTGRAVDLLINNAGVGPGSARERRLSTDGHELIFAVNHLAPFLLTHLMLPLLRDAAPARVVNVASAAQQALDFDDLMLEKSYTPMRAYSQSKLALTMFTFGMAERLDPNSITVNCLHPGSLLDTKMVREMSTPSRGRPESGAEAVIHLALDPQLARVTGAYFDRKEPARAEEQAYDTDVRERLWKISKEMTGLLE